MDDYIWGYFHSGEKFAGEKIHAVLPGGEKTFCGLNMFRGRPFVESERRYDYQMRCLKCLAIAEALGGE